MGHYDNANASDKLTIYRWNPYDPIQPRLNLTPCYQQQVEAEIVVTRPNIATPSVYYTAFPTTDAETVDLNASLRWGSSTPVVGPPIRLYLNGIPAGMNEVYVTLAIKELFDCDSTRRLGYQVLEAQSINKPDPSGQRHNDGEFHLFLEQVAPDAMPIDQLTAHLRDRIFVAPHGFYIAAHDAAREQLKKFALAESTRLRAEGHKVSKTCVKFAVATSSYNRRAPAAAAPVWLPPAGLLVPLHFV